MKRRWRLWLGLVLLALGFAMREHAHSLAVQNRVVETVNRMRNPDGPPACVFDCAYRFSGDAAMFGWFAIALMVLGALLVVWSSVRMSGS